MGAPTSTLTLGGEWRSSSGWLRALLQFPKAGRTQASGPGAGWVGWMPPELYLYLRRCHRCQRHRLESGGPHVPLSLTLTPPLLPSLSFLSYLLPLFNRKKEPESVLGRVRGARGSGLGDSIPLWTCQGRMCSLWKPGSSHLAHTLFAQAKAFLWAKTQASGCPAVQPPSPGACRRKM